MINTGLVGFSPVEVSAVFLVLAVAFTGLFYAFKLRSKILTLAKPSGKMGEVWQGIKQGAEAYLSSQWKIIRLLLVVLTVFLFLSAWLVQPSAEATAIFGARAKLVIAVGRTLAFWAGAVFSATVGRIGMRMAIETSIRVAGLAAENKEEEAFKLAYRGGVITGMLTDGLGLLGGTLIFIAFGKAAPDALLGFGFGGTLLALLMRVGGGIYTKAADIGADLVGKVEAGIPEDDPRNPAVIADLVGDNVGDCAGMAADIFESYEVTMVSSMILGLALWHQTGQAKWIVFPLLIRAAGVLSSILGTILLGLKKDRNALKAISRGFYISAAISIVLFILISIFYMQEWQALGAIIVGVILAIVIDKLTAYFTHTHYKPVRQIAEQAQTSTATAVLSGLAMGFESSVWSILIIAVTIGAAILFYHDSPTIFMLYSVSLTGIGMLTLTGNNVAMDSFGPISDNAGGIGEMAKINETGQKILARLDAAGNTTKAITKGIAIGSAVVAAVSLFGSFITDVEKVSPGTLRFGIRVSEPMVFIGLLVGGSLPFLFSGWLLESVSRAGQVIINEVRRQFKLPGILENTKKPDYAQAVTICTNAAQKELLPIALLAVLIPLIVGFLLGAEPLGASLAGLILASQLVAVLMANTGGAWDNAKKYIEEGNFGGKGSEAHKASVICDTIGDPLKDTSGPALNPLLKVISLIAVIIAPIVVSGTISRPLKLALATSLLIVALWLVVRKSGIEKTP